MLAKPNTPVVTKAPPVWRAVRVVGAADEPLADHASGETLVVAFIWTADACQYHEAERARHHPRLVADTVDCNRRLIARLKFHPSRQHFVCSCTNMYLGPIVTARDVPQSRTPLSV